MNLFYFIKLNEEVKIFSLFFFKVELLIFFGFLFLIKFNLEILFDWLSGFFIEGLCLKIFGFNFFLNSMFLKLLSLMKLFVMMFFFMVIFSIRFWFRVNWV